MILGGFGKANVLDRDLGGSFTLTFTTSCRNSATFPNHTQIQTLQLALLCPLLFTSFNLTHLSQFCSLLTPLHRAASKLPQLPQVWDRKIAALSISAVTLS
jgi:hypothetical protein